ncbi:MAG TPA: FecR domain-containing protein [Tepidisphaeraceae bacterium]|nr:FecR domain-containing protein [Tepidisphaeraceae bacterium]
MRVAKSVTVAMLCFASLARAQSTAPTSDLSIPEGPLQITITGVEGIVQARPSADQPWKRITVGAVLNEGSEFRTGPKSAVRFTIPPDQTVTLDRLGTVQVLRSNFQNGKILTDLGMKYGRTRYDIEAAGREHEATVRSPSSVLAVRGTKVSLDDEPPFAPQAVSLTGRALFRDVKKQIAFGNKNGKTKINQDSDTPAATALNQTVVDPRGEFSGRTPTDQLIQLSLAAYGGKDFSNLGVLSLLDQARRGTFTGTVIGTLFVEQQLRFFVDWPGASLADVDLSVISPSREVVSSLNPQSQSGGFHLGNAVGNPETPTTTETVIWPISVPPGKYVMQIDLKGGTKSPVAVNATADDPQASTPDTGGKFPNRIDFKTVTLSPQNPSVTIPVTVKQNTPVAGGASVKSSRSR